MKKKLMVTGFFISCLIATFLIVTTPSGSLTNTEPPYEYDPWVDVNDDGVIDIFDLVHIGRSYGMSGDPTKDVTVTNFPLDRNVNGNLKVNRLLNSTSGHDEETIQPETSWSTTINTRGYREITILLYTQSNCDVRIVWYVHADFYFIEESSILIGSTHRILNIHGHSLFIWIYNPDSTNSVSAALSWYMTT